MNFYIGRRDKLRNQLKSEFIREIETRKPTSVNNLEFAFIGLDGKKYYHFPNHLNLPIERFAVKRKLLSWMAFGLDTSEYDKLIDLADTALQSGLKTGKGAVDIGWVLKEMKYRREMTQHTELIYQFIALHYIREDEKADIFSNDIQMEKVAQFKKEVEEFGSAFFLTKNELSSIYNMTEMSEQEWTAFWHESLIKQEALKMQIKNLKRELLHP